MDLLTDWIGWGLIFDDQLDSHLGRNPRAAAQIMDGTISLLCADPATPIRPANVLEEAMADLLDRFRSIMSPVWCHRFVAHMRDGLIGRLREVIRRTSDEILDVDELLSQGRPDILAEPLIDFVEVAIGVELAESLNGTMEFQTLRRAVAEAARLINDVFSVDKESIFPDTHNTVLLLERELGLERPQAMWQVKAMVTERVRLFENTQTRIPRLFRALELTDQERAHALSFIVSVGTMLIGQHNAQVESVRYAPNSDRAPAGPVDDLFPEYAPNISDD